MHKRLLSELENHFMLFQQTISTQPFRQWIWTDKENRRLIGFAAFTMAVSFGWLKFMYPYPNFMPPDSYSYLEAASNNEFINIWPIGYSKFLRLVSVFSRSHILLVVVQYQLLICSVLYLLFTIRYLLAPGKWLFRGLLAISIINPLLPHIANFVSSDCLFAALSLVWFTQLLWIIHQPDLRQLLFHSIILLLAFTVRFSAIWYPFISITIILLTSLIPARTKWLSIGSIIIPLLVFIGSTQYEYYKKTGVTQYTAFGGWQMAANALYGYAHAEPTKAGKAPIALQLLHAVVNHHMDSVHKLSHLPYQDIGVYYLWDLKSPLITYGMQQRDKDSIEKPYFIAWAAMGPLYGQYGRWLITEHPGLFLKHFAWPNLLRYYNPPPFFMGAYNLGNTKVDSIAVTWFNWQNNQLPTRLADRNIHLMNFFPTLLAIINPIFIAGALLFIIFGGLKQCSSTGIHILSCMLLVWLGNCVFSVLTAPIELRYQIFPVVITVPFCILFMSGIIRSWQSAPARSLA
jgi:hypothetical protein